MSVGQEFIYLFIYLFFEKGQRSWNTFCGQLRNVLFSGWYQKGIQVDDDFLSRLQITLHSKKIN
jgi:hypothetical protein